MTNNNYFVKGYNDCNFLHVIKMVMHYTCNRFVSRWLIYIGYVYFDSTYLTSFAYYTIHAIMVLDSVNTASQKKRNSVNTVCITRECAILSFLGELMFAGI